MGKGNNLWDDSALTNAFDHAMATYKEMHSNSYVGSCSKEGMDDKTEKDIAVIGNTTGRVESEIDNNTVSSNIEETCQGCKEMPPEDKSAQENSANGNSCIYSDQQNADYTQLVNQYYELENQKQKIVEQLNQSQHFNYQTQAPSSNYQLPQVYGYNLSEHGVQTSYPSCSCHCVAVPLVPAACSECCPSQSACCFQIPGTQSGHHSGANPIISSVGYMNNSSANDSAIKVGMQAVERVINSMKVEFGTSSNENEANTEKEGDTVSLETDLTAVLNAWYMAGLHTGRYLSEKSKKDARQ